MTYAVIGIVVLYIIWFFVSIFNSQKQLFKLYKKYMNINNSKNYKGSDIAFIGVEVYNLKKVKLAKRDGILTDAYSYKKKMIIMSEDVCENCSIASVAIVAHELGHAIQDNNRSFLFRLVVFLQNICYYFFKFALPLLIVGLIMYFVGFYVNVAYWLMGIAVTLLVFNFLLNLLQIPLESNASEIGFNFLKDMDIIEKKEYKKVKKLMSVAGKTYMANFFKNLNPFKWRS